MYYIDHTVKKEHHQKPCKKTVPSEELSDGASLEKEKCEVVAIIKSFKKFGDLKDECNTSKLPVFTLSCVF